jgi:membrane-bound serine protease (ClpP class)
VKSAILRGFLASLGVAIAVLVLSNPATGTSSDRPRVLAVKFNLDISPPTADYFKSEIDHAASGHYDAVVILLDTPGGLLDSMRSMYQKELASKVPVIVYVTPDGARAASAGVWIGQAADVLAMSPISNIGSSSPIDSGGQNIGGDLRKKIRNDAAASLQALAAAHKRNTTWPVKAVKEASNLTAPQALHINVIDTIAPSLPALLQKLDGYHTKDAQRPFTLHLAGASIDNVSPGFITRFLNTVIDPNLISILFLAGLIGLIFEVLHPGVVLPGALGAVSLVISLYGFSVLNPSWGGVVLVVLGVALLVIDLHAVTHGVLTTGGLISLGFGLALLFQNQPDPFHVNTWLVAGIGIAIAGLWAFAIGKGFAARRRPVTTGAASMVGLPGVARGGNVVSVKGELWNAHSATGEPLEPGEEIVVEAVEGGLMLRVRPARVHAPA